jgi:hypothetical protein
MQIRDDMQKLKAISVKKHHSNILEFSPKAKPMPALSLEDFMRKTGARIIGTSSSSEANTSLRHFQILEFRRPEKAN